ncbi:MAG: GNAT family N-acetyltransferase [Bacteroidales bacterium]|nr:GNAT family N-acetyltransferase [Bacteroidales bacterium]
MKIVELHTLNRAQSADLLGLMKELDPDIEVTPEMLSATVASTTTHLFAAVDDGGRMAGCASLCVFASPTGLKASVEDVVVGSAFRGQHLGRALLDHIISYARAELAPVDIHLTSRPHRVAANALYRSLGFKQKETNVYILSI